MLLNYTAKHDLKILYIAKLSFNYRGYMYVVFTCARILKKVVSIDETKRRKINNQ